MSLVPYLRRGTLPYMAPELVSDPDRVSEKADVWSLGMVLWEMLTLETPFTHLTPQQIIAGLMVGNLQPEVSLLYELPLVRELVRVADASPKMPVTYVTLQLVKMSLMLLHMGKIFSCDQYWIPWSCLSPRAALGRLRDMAKPNSLG